MAIMHPESEQEKQDALIEAASGPVLFQKLTDQFQGQRPSETNLRSWLLRNGFARSAVDNVVRAYGETMDLVSSYAKSYKSEAQAAPAALPERRPQMYGGGVAIQTGPADFGGPAGEPFSVEMLKGRVRVVGELSNKEDAQTLLDFLKSAISFLPAKQKLWPVEGDSTQGPHHDEDDDL